MALGSATIGKTPKRSTMHRVAKTRVSPPPCGGKTSPELELDPALAYPASFRGLFGKGDLLFGGVSISRGRDSSWFASSGPILHIY
jgi:hypothetical protein